MRKPQAFRHSQLRDDLLPSATYKRIWSRLDALLEPRAACKRIVGILALAARAGCEQALGAWLLPRLEAGHAPGLHELERRFDPRAAGTPRLPSSGGAQHPLSLYDDLLSQPSTEIH